MENFEPQKANKIEGKDKLKSILDWAQEGPGTHNFIVIESETLDSESRELLEHEGYTLVIFDDLTKPEERIKLQELLVHAQSYMERHGVPKHLPSGKITIVFSKSSWEQLQSDEQTLDAWKANRAYTTFIDDFR